MKAVYLEAGAVSKGDISLAPITELMDTVVYENTTEADKFEHIGDAEIVYANKVIFDEETLARCPNLRYIGVCATGYNVIDLEATGRHGVTVTNVPAYSTESVAQMAWGMILECACNIEKHNASVHQGDWIQSETFCYWIDRVTELDGKTIGIVGYGNIGKRVAQIARAFHMNVLVTTAHPDKYKEEAKEAGITLTDLDTVFAQADVISLHCPLNDQTAGLICKANLARMKDGVILINVSRGGLVCEADLAEALTSGKVYRAAVDVVATEPMLKDNPLYTAPNLIITPHIAWASVEARTRLIRVVADNVKAYLSGDPIHVVHA